MADGGPHRPCSPHTDSLLGLTALRVFVIQQELSEADTGAFRWHSANPRADITCQKHSSYFSLLVTCRHNMKGWQCLQKWGWEAYASSLHTCPVHLGPCFILVLFTMVLSKPSSLPNFHPSKCAYFVWVKLHFPIPPRFFRFHIRYLSIYWTNLLGTLEWGALNII